MKLLTKTMVAGALLGALPLAQAEGPHEFSANVAVTTDYIFRGISQTSEDPALSGGFDYGHESGFYAGFWASSIEFNAAGNADDASVEMDVYAGYAGEAGAISYDIAGLYYAYPTQDEDAGAGDFDYFEAILGLGYSVTDMVGVGFTYAYSPDFFGEIGDGHYFGANVDLALPQGFGASVVVGRQNFSDVTGDYTHWSAGISKEIGMFGFDLTYHDTNAEDIYGSIAGSRVVFTVSSGW
jgi:uncharacterized protein (TIGR02001 family)